MVVSTKKKRVSKKTKSSWRKHVDINDVDEFLEEQRFEERMGKPLSTLEDKELFVIDTTSSNEQKLTPKQLKRQRLREAPLKCLSFLKPLTNVPDPIAKRNRVRTKEERKSAILKKKEALNKARGIFKKKDVQAVRNMKLDAEKRQKERLKSKVDLNKNVWEETEQTDMEKKIRECEWITGDTERNLIYGTGKPQKNVPKLITQKLSDLSSVETPHPGMSYNPSLKDHQDLLAAVVEREKKIIKEEEHINRVTVDMFRKVSPAERDSSWLIEMSEGIPIPGQNLDEKEMDQGEYKAVNPPTENKKKSLKQRRKQKEQLKLEEERRKKKVEKKKITDILKLPLINKSIAKIEEKRIKLFQKKLNKKERKKKEAKRLANLKFEEPDIDFNMKTDISGSLRNIKIEGNLLADRFKSMQKRNILEPTVKRHKKEAKVKKFIKSDHKEDWKKTVARPGFLPKK